MTCGQVAAIVWLAVYASQTLKLSSSVSNKVDCHRKGKGSGCIKELTRLFRVTQASPKGEYIMLKWALIFFVVAIVAAVFGFGGIAAGAAGIAKILFYIFVVIFVVSLIMGLMRRAT